MTKSLPVNAGCASLICLAALALGPGAFAQSSSVSSAGRPSYVEGVAATTQFPGATPSVTSGVNNLTRRQLQSSAPKFTDPKARIDNRIEMRVDRTVDNAANLSLRRGEPVEKRPKH